MTLTELIKENHAHFDFYRQGIFYYVIHMDIFDKEISPGVYDRNPKLETYRFGIPADDLGNGTLNKSEKCITLMRWIRKAHSTGELIKIS